MPLRPRTCLRRTSARLDGRGPGSPPRRRGFSDFVVSVVIASVMGQGAYEANGPRDQCPSTYIWSRKSEFFRLARRFFFVFLQMVGFEQLTVQNSLAEF